jgi:hypothetical protein
MLHCIIIIFFLLNQLTNNIKNWSKVKLLVNLKFFSETFIRNKQGPIKIMMMLYIFHF